MFEDDDNDCRKDHRCELVDRHHGPCRRYVPHSDMCGCTRCAWAYESENPQRVYDSEELK